MKTYLLRRLASYCVIFLIAISLNFILPRLMPGDPMQLIAGNAVRQLGPERLSKLRSDYGLDKPLGEQYLHYLKMLASGDLGYSYRYSGGKSVSQVLGEHFIWTVFLVTSSLALAISIGTSLGVWAAWQNSYSRDLGLLVGLFTLRSIPSFWLALILIPIFSVRLGWFPSGDSYSIPRLAGWENVQDVLHHAALPIAVLTIAYIPTAFAIARASMLNVVGEDYIRTAFSKGLSDKRVIFRHALRSAALPILTVFALDFGQLLGGVTLIEVVFNYRGIGNMMFEAVKSRDYPLLQGGFLLFTLVVLTINFLLDWIYPRLDHRVTENHP
jgi:peptide/nickel transport system permease protein